MFRAGICLQGQCVEKPLLFREVSGISASCIRRVIKSGNLNPLITAHLICPCSVAVVQYVQLQSEGVHKYISIKGDSMGLRVLLYIAIQ
jgi:hypothetical protein